MKRTSSKSGYRSASGPGGVRSLREIRAGERTFVPKRSAGVSMNGGLDAVELARAKKEIESVDERLRRDELKAAIEIAKRRFC